MSNKKWLAALKNSPVGQRSENQHIFKEVKEKKRQGRKPSTHVLWMKEEIQAWCKDNGLVFHEELRFNDLRKFRLDFGVTDTVDHREAKTKIVIEYQGGVFMDKSGHSKPTGATRDCTKSNLAQSEGWNYLTFTVLNYRTVIQELEKFNEFRHLLKGK